MATATASLEIVEPHIGHQRSAIVAGDAHPWSDVAILSDRRAAALRTIIVSGAQLSHSSARVEPPVVPERDVGVGIVRGLERQPGRSPVLPPVVVQLKAVVELSLVPVEESGPRIPRHLVGPPEVAEVIDLEPFGTPLIVGLEQQMLSADLAELELLRVAGELRSVRVEWKVGVRTLIIVHRVSLRRENHRGRSLHATLIE